MKKSDDSNRSTHERIFSAAVDLFSRKGFSGVSVRDITRTVGINEASLYNHFANKEAVLREIIDCFRAASKSALLSESEIDHLLETHGPYNLLLQTLALYAQSMSDQTIGKISNILTIEQFHNDEVRDLLENELITKPRMFYTSLFEKMTDKKMIKPLPPSVLATEYLSYSTAVYYEYAILKRGNVEVSELASLARSHIDFFWDMIKL